MFEGLPGRVFLTYDLTALEERKYYEAGVLIGWSLTQGGPGPRCLHPALYQVLVSGFYPPIFLPEMFTFVASVQLNLLPMLQTNKNVESLLSFWY